MKDKSSVKEHIKTVIIILLIISMVFLGWQSRIFSGTAAGNTIFSGLFGKSGTTESGGFDNERNYAVYSSFEIARPSCIVITNAGGEHYGVKYDFSELVSVYERTGSIFCEAIGTSGKFTEINKKAWESALQAVNVYFEYYMPMRLDILSYCMNEETPAGLGITEVKRMAVAIVDGVSRLYFCSEQTGKCYMSETSISAESILSRIGLQTNSAISFAFEKSSDFIDSIRYQVIFDNIEEYPIVVSDNPLRDRNIEDFVLTQLGINLSSASNYTEADGTEVFVGSDFTLRLKSDGNLAVKITEQPLGRGSEMTPGEIVGFAWQTVSGCVSGTVGEASVFLESYEEKGDESIVTFQYAAAGGRVNVLGDGFAAKVIVENDEISEITLNLRKFEITNEMIHLLPALQSVAAAGEEIIINYTDMGLGRLEPKWVHAY